jgi:hypothetical protein
MGEGSTELPLPCRPTLTQEAWAFAHPAEREQRYQKVLRELRDPKFYQIRITGMLLKRGYLWPNERDDLNALRQAVILFIWDTIRKTPNRKDRMAV